eukprot:1128865-Alexandrium_andersonii.AAC.1
MPATIGCLVLRRACKSTDLYPMGMALACHCRAGTQLGNMGQELPEWGCLGGADPLGGRRAA